MDFEADTEERLLTRADLDFFFHMQSSKKESSDPYHEGTEFLERLCAIITPPTEIEADLQRSKRLTVSNQPAATTTAPAKAKATKVKTKEEVKGKAKVNDRITTTGKGKKNSVAKRRYVKRETTSLAPRRPSNKRETGNCPFCFHSMRTDLMQRHINMTHLKIKISCEKCDAEFSSKQRLHSHMKSKHA